MEEEEGSRARTHAILIEAVSCAVSFLQPCCLPPYEYLLRPCFGRDGGSDSSLFIGGLIGIGRGEQTMAAPSKQEVRAWCRMCYGADWHQNNKAARLAEARAALSVPSNLALPI